MRQDDIEWRVPYGPPETRAWPMWLGLVLTLSLLFFRVELFMIEKQVRDNLAKLVLSKTEFGRYVSTEFDYSKTYFYDSRTGSQFAIQWSENHRFRPFPLSDKIRIGSVDFYRTNPNKKEDEK